MLVAVVTGDIVHSRSVKPEIWLPSLKNFIESDRAVLRSDIYRGDSFQVELYPDDALRFAICLKALVRSKSFQIDTRLAIGIGDVAYYADRVAESNGSAYVRSGESLDALKFGGLVLKTSRKNLDDILNPILRLITFISNQWKPATAHTIFLALQNEGIKQKDLAAMIGKNTSTISQALKRGAFDEMMDVLRLYPQIVKNYV